MNDITKEILDNLKYVAKKHTIQVLENGGKIERCPQEVATEMRLNTYSANILLDYITNLQQENERLKQPKIFIDTQDMEERYGEELYKDYLEKQVKDYKSRIEKSIEYIKNCPEYLWANVNTKVLLNILNGRSDTNVKD